MSDVKPLLVSGMSIELCSLQLLVCRFLYCVRRRVEISGNLKFNRSMSRFFQLNLLSPDLAQSRLRKNTGYDVLSDQENSEWVHGFFLTHIFRFFIKRPNSFKWETIVCLIILFVLCDCNTQYVFVAQWKISNLHNVNIVTWQSKTKELYFRAKWLRYVAR